MKTAAMRLSWCERSLKIADLKDGNLYVAGPYAIASHLCACACGGETVTPLGEGGWKLAVGPTLRPYIGTAATCGAHHYVTEGRVGWL